MIKKIKTSNIKLILILFVLPSVIFGLLALILANTLIYLIQLLNTKLIFVVYDIFILYTLNIWQMSEIYI